MTARITRALFKIKDDTAIIDRVKFGAFVGTGIGSSYSIQKEYNGPTIYNS